MLVCSGFMHTQQPKPHPSRHPWHHWLAYYHVSWLSLIPVVVISIGSLSKTKSPNCTVIDLYLHWPPWPWRAANRSRQSRTGGAGVPGGRPCGALWGTDLWPMSSPPPMQQTSRENKSRNRRWITCVLCVRRRLLYLYLYCCCCVCFTFLHSYLSVQAQENDHNEETHGPQLRQRHHGYRLRICNERQPWAWGSLY